MDIRIEGHLRRSLPAAFSYDHESGLFRRDDETFTPEALPLSSNQLAAIEEPENIPNAPLVHTFRAPVMMPQFFDWLDDNFNKDLADETVEVMQEVFSGLAPHALSTDLDHRGGFIGFNANYRSDEHPDILLQTLGNCACMYLSQSGPFAFNPRYGRIGRLETHNVDTPLQRTTVLAGLGHLAHRANQAQ